jgi:acetyl-CoA C-acetyltransferase
MGCVLPANLGQAPARQAALSAGLPVSVPCTTINKVCGSSLKTVCLAAQAIKCGDSKIVVAGGMENMSAAPYALAKARSGYRMGDDKIFDLMVRDGLWDPYNDMHMGGMVDKIAEEYGITREMQDEYATESYRRSLKSIKEGLFKEEIVPVEVPGKKEAVIVDTDEEPGRVNFDKIKTLKGAFNPKGTVTAANASSINDGAAAVVVMSTEEAEKRKIKPMVRILGYAQAALDPARFAVAPVPAMKKAFEITGLKPEDIDLFELNEAFSAQIMACNKDLPLPMDRVNRFGGAVSIGHPIGGSGARVLITLLYGMKRTGAKRGLATLCIGGGEGIAMIVENVK